MVLIPDRLVHLRKDALCGIKLHVFPPHADELIQIVMLASIRRCAAMAKFFQPSGKPRRLGRRQALDRGFDFCNGAHGGKMAVSHSACKSALAPALAPAFRLPRRAPPGNLPAHAMADSSDPKAPSTKPQQPAAKINIITRIGRIFAAPFVAVGHIVRGGRKPDEIVVYSAPPAFFLWFVIAMGFVLNLLVGRLLLPSAGAWIFIFTLVYFLLAVLYDMSLKKLALCTLVVATLWLFAQYMDNRHHIVFLSWILHHLAVLNPQFDHGTVSVLCWLLLIPWVASIFEMVFDRKKQFSPNEIAEFHFGEGSELTDRSGLRFVTKYRDVLETLLGFGGGDLLAVDNQQRVIKRFENVVGLWFHWEKLDRILHQRATLLDEDAEKSGPDRDKPDR